MSIGGLRKAIASLICCFTIGLGFANSVRGQVEVKPIEPGVTSESMQFSSSQPRIEWVEFELFKPSEHEFDYISPMTNMVYFEDPRHLTEIRPFFFNHKVPQAAGGGEVQLYGAQIRLRLTENMSFIAIKDGYATTTNPILGNGWADIAAGLKFTLLRNVQTQSLLSGGFTFEFPSGESAIFQGNGDGEMNFFLSGGTKLTNRISWLAASGVRVPVNTTDESTSSYWSNHVDFEVTRWFYFLTEVNWFHWLKSGKDGPLTGIEGLDVINFGNPGVAGNDIVTSAIGFKLRPSRHFETGVAWQFPLTQRRDIIDNRLLVDMRLRY